MFFLEFLPRGNFLEFLFIFECFPNTIFKFSKTNHKGIQNTDVLRNVFSAVVQYYKNVPAH